MRMGQTTDKKSCKEKITSCIYLLIAIGLFVIIVLSWYNSGFIVACLFSAEKSNSTNQFEAITALFTGLAFAGMIITLFMQRTELRLQREDLRLQRDEMKVTNAELAGQKEQFELQNKTLSKQQFESTFFQLMNQVNSVTEIVVGKEGVGMVAFSKTYLYFVFRTREVNNPNMSDEIDLKVCKREYNTIFSRYTLFGLYFRSLYRLIKYVHDSELTDYEKYQYTSFVRAQLSDDVLLLLFYSCTIGPGEEKFKSLLEKYVLLNNMPKDRLVSPRHLSRIDNKAFERGDRYNKGQIK